MNDLISIIVPVYKVHKNMVSVMPGLKPLTICIKH